MREALGQDPIIAKFFFDFRAKDGIENNFEGLRRSLLFQILTTSETLAADVKQHFGMNRLDDQIMLASVGLFEYVLQKNNQLSLLFIHGLDEYPGDKTELLNLVKRITRSKVKVCLSSRYENPFTITFQNLTFQFRMDLLNRPGILAYAEQTFAANLSPSNDEELREIKSAAETVAKVSAGVFLWTRFAVSEIIGRVCEGNKMERLWIQKMVVDIPQNLEQIYTRLFESVKEKDKKACALIFALIRAGQRGFELAELFAAVLLVGNDLCSHQNTIASMNLASFRQYLMSFGAGLIELGRRSGQSNHKSVRLIHKSVETYMDRRSRKELFGDWLAQESDQEICIEVCTKYITSNRAKRIAGASKQESVCPDSIHPTSRTPFADYARRSILRNYVYVHLLKHAYNFEQETAKSSRSLIYHILDTTFFRRHIDFFFKGRSSCSDCHRMDSRIGLESVFGSGIQLAVWHRLTLYVKEAITLSPEAFISDSFISGFSATDQNQSWSGPAASVGDPMTSPLVTALLCHYHDPTPERLNLVLSLIPHSSRLRDTDMLVAVREAPKTAIEALLMQFPRGPLHLLSKSLYHGIANERDSVYTTLPVEHPIGPL